MFEHLRTESQPKQYVAEVEHRGFFKWDWIITERTWFPPSLDGPLRQDTTIIYGTRRTRRQAERVAVAMRDGFIAMPLPEKKP
jgi:hypothetical protein